jgi:hypothetical protein
MHEEPPIPIECKDTKCIIKEKTFTPPAKALKFAL